MQGNKMDDMVFETSDQRLESPLATKAKSIKGMGQVQQTNAIKDGLRKDIAISPTRIKHQIINKKQLDQSVASTLSSQQQSKMKAQSQNGSSKAAITDLSPQALGATGFSKHGAGSAMLMNKDLQTAGGVGSAQQRQALSDVKDLGVVGGKKRSDQNDSQSAINLNSQKEDSFQKLYSKELDLDEDEVPIILHELNDSAIHFISHEQYERSLSLLQKAQTLLDRLKFQKNPKDRFLIQVTMHNMALCFQKMGALEECALCLDACLHQINSQYLAPTFSKKPTKKLKKLKYECKIHMQVCALLSQLHRHEEALLHAKQAVQISQYLINDLTTLCELNVEKTIVAKKNEQSVHEEQERQKLEGVSISQTSSQADLIYYDHSISMLERTALRVYPIIKEIQNRMVKHKDVPQSASASNPDKTNKEQDKTLDLSMQEGQSLNMKVLLGYLNQSEWLYLLNIGNIMQITPLTIHDLYSNQKIDVELSRDSILEKVTFLAISYFCVSTELRFLVSSKEKLSFDPVYVKAESEFWHGKALEISCGFLPSESPLVTHILSSYQKHHAPVQQAIPENEEEDQGLRVIRPEKGIDKSQFQPIVRLNKHLNIALSPLRLSPNNHRIKPKKKVEVKEASVGANLVASYNQQSQQQLQRQKQFQDEQAQLFVQAASLHNPSKRSIEFSNNQNSNVADSLQQNSNIGQVKSDNNGPPSNVVLNGTGPDVVEYELQSFDQSDIQTQGPKVVPSNSNHHQIQQNQQHSVHQNQQPQATTTPNRQFDQSNGSKIQMAVPSPNALASAMQKEQRESLSQQSSIQERPSARQLQRETSTKTHHTQRQVQNGLDRFPQDNQSSSFQNLPAKKSKLLLAGDHLQNQGSDSQHSLSKQHESISEEELIKLASDGNKQQNQDSSGLVPYHTQNNRVVQSGSTPDSEHLKPSDQSTELVNFEIARKQQQQQPSLNANYRQSASGAKVQQQDQQPVNQSKIAIGSGQRVSHNLGQSDPRQQETSMDERTPTVVKTDHSARLSANVNNTGQSQRSRSKGKLSKKKGAMTQPQTHQNSANNTAFDPLRQVKEISQFGSGGDKKQQVRPVTEGDEDFNIGQKARPSHGKIGYKSGHTNGQQAKTVQAGRTTTSSLENRASDQVNNHRPPSSQGLKLERPDSRRLIGGKRRQIKDSQQSKQQGEPTSAQGIQAVRSSSAGRRNQQNQVISMQGYKTNDQSMTSASSHVQFTMSNGQQQHQNGPQQTQNNFKNYQQTRKAVTAHSTQASNSPRKGLQQQQQSKFTDNTNAVRLSKHAHGVQDPVFMTTNQLNQSRSTIENNNSTLIDRSMNDQLMLNNSSFEVGSAQSRSRSFAKTGALSQQNSRDVILGTKKSKNTAVQQTHAGQSNHTVATGSKSLSKQKASKEMLTYLNQGTTAQKSMNNLIASQQSQQSSSKYNSSQIEIDYRKQLLIKQALDMQNQSKDSSQQQTRQKSGAAGKVVSGRTQMAFQTHTSSVQMPPNHSSSINQPKQQSRSSHGLRKSSQGIQKEQNNQSQKVLSNNQQAQIQLMNNLDPQAIAAISQALNQKGQGNQQQNAQQIYNQLMQFNQTNGSQVSGANGKKQSQNTHTMIKKFLKERATPQPTSIPNSQSGMILGQQNGQQPQSRSGQSLSPNPGFQSSNTGGQSVQGLKHSTTLIDNFTQAPFLASSTSTGGVPQSKQAHTTKAASSQHHDSVSASATGKQPRNFNPSKIYTQKQPLVQKTISSGKSNNAAAALNNSYFTEQQVGPVQRKGASERFNNLPNGDRNGPDGQQREPTPVFHHLPYQKPEDPMVTDAKNQYPMMQQQPVGQQQKSSAKSQLAAMYKSIKQDKK